MNDQIWSWRWGPPGVADQYSFGDNPIFDAVRLFIIVLGIVLVFAILRVIVEQRRRHVCMPRAQWARYIALLLMDVTVSITEAWVMGTPATPRLVVNLLAVGFAIYGVHGARLEQLDQPIRPDAGRRG